MAARDPKFSFVTQAGKSVPVVVWEDIATGDTISGFLIVGGGIAEGGVQIGGTFGSATVKLQASVDGATYIDMKDIGGNNISATSAALFSFTTGALFIRPAISGGTSDAVDVTLSVRT